MSLGEIMNCRDVRKLLDIEVKQICKAEMSKDPQLKRRYQAYVAQQESYLRSLRAN